MEEKKICGSHKIVEVYFKKELGEKEGSKAVLLEVSHGIKRSTNDIVELGGIQSSFINEVDREFPTYWSYQKIFSVTELGDVGTISVF